MKTQFLYLQLLLSCGFLFCCSQGQGTHALNSRMRAVLDNQRDLIAKFGEVSERVARLESNQKALLAKVDSTSKELRELILGSLGGRSSGNVNLNETCHDLLSFCYSASTGPRKDPESSHSISGSNDLNSYPRIKRRAGSPYWEGRNPSCHLVRRHLIPGFLPTIVGGIQAERHEFPWQVSLQERRYNHFAGEYYYVLDPHICGGVIIDKNWVVTAAHCANTYSSYDLKVVAGEHRLKYVEGTEQTRDVERIIQHPEYNDKSLVNDIALLRIRNPLTMDGRTVVPVALPNPLSDFRGNCVASGWGDVSEGERASDMLQKVTLPIMSNEKCDTFYRSINYPLHVLDSMICAGYVDARKEACQGDSGGPFVCGGPDNKTYLTGIVSWGHGCARQNNPGVFTKVSHYVEWINTVMHGYTSNREPDY